MDFHDRTFTGASPSEAHTDEHHTIWPIELCTHVYMHCLRGVVSLFLTITGGV